MKNGIIVLLGLALLWFGSAVIRLERYHYASMLGSCGAPNALDLVKRDMCLHRKETRTSPLWHLVYGLRDH